MNCDHTYVRKMDGTHVCAVCTSPMPPLAESVIRELNNGIRAINALHTRDQKFEITIVRGADSGMTMFDIMALALDELEVRRRG